MDLNQKVIVITGGAQGLGFAMAKGCAERGARLALIDMNADALQSSPCASASVGGGIGCSISRLRT